MVVGKGRTPTSTDPERPRRIVRAAGVGLGVVASIATIAAAVIAGLDRWSPRDDDGSAVGAQVTDGASPRGENTRNDAPVTTSPSVTDEDTVSLVDLPLADHSDPIGDMPQDLSDDLGFRDAVVIDCPTNQTGDTSTDIVFEAFERYHSLDATITAYRESDDARLVEVQIHSDPADRRPQANQPAVAEAPQAQVEAGSSAQVFAEIDTAYFLRLRVMCEAPDGVVLVTGSSLRAD